MKFIADAMLGKLARLLRIIGYDTLYEPSLSDDAILSIVSHGGRILLTRDAVLHRRAVRAGGASFLIKSTFISNELAEISSLIDVAPPGSRCPLCNTLLDEIERAMVSSSVIPEVDEVWVCPKCGKFYWHGSHWRSINRTLKVLYTR